ncbi:MAG: hypothetical protein HZA93_12860 [Verrucomicrobia bacterium]|nr:hypothetical protein [Verrucomicrobiota bacterium]
MNWISTLIKVAGSVSPLTSPLVQLQSEMDSAALQARLVRLEDPLSALQPDIPEASAVIYSIIKKTEDASFKLEDDTYQRFRRALAILESRGHIVCAHRLGHQVPLGIRVSDPGYLLFYLCPRFEDGEKMRLLVKTIDECTPGHWLDGKAVARELGLPVPVVKACFDLYEEKGYGFSSREIGRVSYCGRV